MPEIKQQRGGKESSAWSLAGLDGLFKPLCLNILICRMGKVVIEPTSTGWCKNKQNNTCIMPRTLNKQQMLPVTVNCYASCYVKHNCFATVMLPWWLRRWSICLQCGRSGLDSWVGKIPWRRKWQSTPSLLPGKSHGRRSLIGYSPWGRKESDMTERLHSEL